MTENLKTTWANKTIFFLLCLTVVWTALAYGTVHQPLIALFYLVIAVIIVLWAIDAFSSRTLRFNKSLIQVPLLAFSLYALIQIIPFGSLAEIGGVSGIPRTISHDPFWTRDFGSSFFRVIHCSGGSDNIYRFGGTFEKTRLADNYFRFRLFFLRNFASRSQPRQNLRAIRCNDQSVVRFIRQSS